MKKNKQTPASTSTTTTATTALSDIKTLIRDCAAFFDNLVDLIPARFYLPVDTEDKPWFQGLPKGAKQELKRQSKENIKKSRRERLDPDKAASKSTNQILKESLESGKEKSSENQSVGRSSVTIEELQQRLRKRIEELRAGRGGGGRSERREKREERKRKWEEGRERGKKKDEEEGKSDGGNERDIEKEAEEAAKDIEFGKVKLRAGIDDGSFNKKKKKRKLTKEEELKRALELQEAKKDPEKGETVAKKHSWKAATERTMGKKVHDDPKLLKQSLKKEKKKHKKSVEKWKQRTEVTQKMKQEKQDKRKENIKGKIDQRKQKKIEKREKKLMRPGFEGRKEGFVNGA